jgi:hypothetical protein
MTWPEFIALVTCHVHLLAACQWYRLYTPAVGEYCLQYQAVIQLVFPAGGTW